ncbi:hypothetical protein [Streptomyces axinellae]|uniref:Uncharacterized protein n=1 Tax=Streptomyces axinellae TaxID=552788 RepID=A0ABN3PRI0_9ACTN
MSAPPPPSLAELRALAPLHARAQGISRVRATLLGSALRGLGVHPVRRAVPGLAGGRPAGPRGGGVHGRRGGRGRRVRG